MGEPGLDVKGGLDEHLEKATNPEVKNKLLNLYIGVVIFLGVITITSIVGIIILAAMGETVPPELLALGSVALGALAGLVGGSSAAE